MKWIKKHKRVFITVVVALCVLVIAVTGVYRINPTFAESTVGVVVTPLQKAFTAVGSWFGDRIGFFTQMGSLSGENTKLKSENERLTAENNRLQEVDQENQRLSALLDMAQRYSDYPTIGANIVSMDAGNWYFKYTLDVGTNKGLKQNMVILAAGGLAGKIYEVGWTYAKVVSLIDDSSAVSAQSQRTGDTGFVVGDASLKEQGLCLMNGLAGDADVAVGDEIMTGHLSAIYPPGIEIGTVKSVSVAADGTKTAVIQPVVDFKHMESVLVITQLYDTGETDTATPTPTPKAGG